MACLADTRFGPVLSSGADLGCRSFDFTDTFEAAFLALTPSILILPVIGHRAWYIFKRSKVVDWLLALTIKPILYFSLAALQLAELSLYASRNELKFSELSVPASAFILFAIINLSFLSLLEHSRTPSPSPIIQAYLLLTLIFDVVRLRTRWLLPGSIIIASLQSAGLAIKVLLLVVESLSKNSHLLLQDAATFSPEDKAGFFSRSLLWWLNPLFIQGYRGKLSHDDLYPVDIELGSAKLTDKLYATWNNTGPNRRHGLAISLVKAFWKQILIIQLPRLALVGFALTQPFLIKAAISFIANHSSKPVNYGYGLIGAFAIVYIGVAITTLWEQHLTFRLLVMIRGSLIGVIFKHSLALPASESSGASGAVSLMSTDMERIQQTLQWVMNVGPNVVQVGFGLWILEIFLGPVIVAPLIVAIACAIVSAQVGQRIPPRQRRWMQAIQKRVGVTTNAIGDVRGVKMSGLGGRLATQIQGYRASEIEDQKSFRQLQITNITLGNIPGMLTPAVTFTAFAISQLVSGGRQFQVETAFTSLAFISILTGPVAELVSATTNLASALSCLDRIEQFLQTKPQQDSRSLPPPISAVVDDSFQNIPHELHELNTLGVAPKSHSGRETVNDPHVSISNASFGWDADKQILTDISLKVIPAMLMMVIGPVGVGKSTLLLSLLGETCILSGSVDCASPKQIAYCDQQPWILNLSIKQNILGVSNYNEERYQQVIKACQLNEDFDQLTKGDETITGSKGLSLSGGQKQRISLARAAYSRKQLIVLDDPFNGLDATTSLRCFHALLGISGLFRAEGRAVVLATHNAQWFPYADEIIVLGREGRITAKGKFDKLKLSSSYVRQVVDSQENIKYTSTQDETVQPVSESSSRDNSVSNLTSKNPTVLEVQPDEIHTEKPRDTSGLQYYLSSMGRKAVWGFAALVLFQVGCSTAQPLWLKHWVAENEKNPDESIGVWVGVYMAFALGQVIFIALGTGYFLLLLIPRSAKNIHRKLLDATFGAPLSFFVTQDTGVIVNLFTGDLNLVDLALPISCLLTAGRLLYTIAEIVLTCVASGYLAISIPFLAIVLYLLQRVYLKTSRQLRTLDLELKAPLFSYFIATNAGLTTIRAFSWTSIVEKENTRLLDMCQRPHYLLFCLQRWLALVLDLVTAGMATLLMGLAVALRDSIDPGYLGVALVSVMGFGQIISGLIVSWTNLETSLQAVTRIQQYAESTPVEYKPLPNDPQGPIPGPDTWPSQGEIIISDLSASYGSLKVLENINLVFKGASKVAICGRTGSGKSSLLGLLLRMYEPSAGLIIIDDQNLTAIPPNQVRDSIVALPQDPIFLTGTVKFNLDPFAAHIGNDEKLWSVLEKTGLKELVETKGGLDTELVIDGFSAGQRQLFCLARIMLRRGQVLLMDEATSRLDSETENLVNELVKVEFKDWTVIVVTHRLKAVAAPSSGFDQVVVLDKGRVIEVGTTADLLRKKTKSVFREMVEMQGS